MNVLSEHNRILRGGLVYTAGGDVFNSGWEYTPSGEISGYSGSAFYQQECPCDSAAIVDSAFNKSTAWADEQNYLTAHQDVTNLPYVQNSALEFSPQGLISGISGSGLYATSAEGALNAETANFAYNAEHADSSDSAQSATSALYANSASSALNAEIANVAYLAISAQTVGPITAGWGYNENSAITSYNGSAFSVAEGDITPYSAGANIDITNHVVSGKDWSDEITAASANAVNEAVNQITAVDLANSALTAQTAINANHAASANSATYDSLGRKIVDTYLTAHQDWTQTIQNASGNAYNSAVNWVVDQHYLTAVTGDNTPYTAGPNIDITNHVVSGKDWTTEIQNASSYAVDQATAQIPAVTGLPYVENSALAYTPGGHLVSSISGDALYAVSAEGAFKAETANYSYTAETANYAHVAESANYVEGGWEFNTANQITGYSGSAFAATGGGGTGGKIYTGIAPIVVDNIEDKISANTIPLSAGAGISIAESDNKVVISCVNAGNVKFSNVLGGADLANASAQVTLERVNEPSTINWYKLKLTNETGNNATFTLLPDTINSGYLYCYGNGALGTLTPKESDIWVYAFDSATNSINVNKAGTYKEVHLTTPRNYNAYPEYTAAIDGQVFVMESSCYCDLIRQDIEGTAKWCVKISGEYIW